MLVGFSPNSKGAGRDPVLYLTSPKTHEGVTRLPLPEVVQGKPGEVRELIDALPYRHKYAFGWLSFAEKAKDVPEKTQRRIMNEFEEAAFSGIDPANRPPVLWVRHTHTSSGRLELHFLAPRFVYLPNGEIRSHNISPPGKQSRELFNNFRSMINARYGYGDPDDPARTRNIKLSNALSLSEQIAMVKGDRTTAKARDDIKLLIREYVRGEVDKGRIHSRDDVVDVLKSAGMFIPRENPNYVTVLDPASGDRFRMKGTFFDKVYFDSNHMGGVAAQAQDAYGRPDPDAAATFATKLESLKAARASYNQARYSKTQTWDDAGRSENLRTYLNRHLGSAAVAPNPQHYARSFLAINQQRRRKRRILQYNAATEQFWETWVEEGLER